MMITTNRALTLVELVTVCAIIVVLVGMGDMEEAPKKCFGGARQGRVGAGGRGKERVEGDSYRR